MPQPEPEDFPVSADEWKTTMEELRSILNETPRALTAQDHKSLLSMLTYLMVLSSTAHEYALLTVEENKILFREVEVLRKQLAVLRKQLAVRRVKENDDKPKDPTIN